MFHEEGLFIRQLGVTKDVTETQTPTRSLSLSLSISLSLACSKRTLLLLFSPIGHPTVIQSALIRSLLGLSSVSIQASLAKNRPS